MKLIPRLRTVFQDQLSDYITAIAWSPDHRLFAISAAGELVQWTVERTGWARTELSPKTPNGSEMASGDLSLPPPALNALEISANGQFLAVAGQAGTLGVWDIAQNPSQIINTQTFHSLWLDQLAWHPSDSILAAGVGSQVYLWHALQTKPIRILDFESSTVLNMAWHPSGQRLAVGGHGGVKIWDMDSQDSPALLEVPGASLCTEWSPDGKFLASGNLDRTLSVMDCDHPPPWLMQGFPGKVNCIAWEKSPDQNRLLAAAASDGITLWGQNKKLNWQSSVLTGHQGLIRDIAFQPNGKLLASAGNESIIRLWLAGKTPLQQSLKGPQEGTHCLSWNPSGTGLAVGGTDGTILICELDHAGKGFG